MNIALYARVSTDWQAEHGYSLDTQVDACTAKAYEIGADTIKNYVDDGYSGAYLERPALETLRDALHDKLYDAVVCYDPDRLARKLSHQLILTEEIEKSGAQLIFVSMEFKNTPEGQLFYQIHGAFADYEREKIRERTMRGKRGKLRTGKPITDSHVYGYDFDKENSVYVHNEIKCQIINKIHDLYQSGLAGGVDFLTIYMNKHPEEFPTSSPNGWSSSLIKNILRREMYTGEYWSQTQYHKKTGVNKWVRLPRPKTEWIRMTCPQYITREKYEKTQLKLDRQRKYVTWHSLKGIYLLQGILFCGKCGQKMSIINGSKKEKYYGCMTRSGYQKPFSCGARYGRTNIVDEIFWDVLKNICTSPATLSRYINRNVKKPTPSPILDDVDKIRKKIEKIKNERQVVMSWFGQSLLSQSDATLQLEKLKQQELTLQKQLETATKLVKQHTIDVVDICNTVQTCPPDPASHRAVVMKIIDRVYMQRMDTNYGKKYDLNLKIHFQGQ